MSKSSWVSSGLTRPPSEGVSFRFPLFPIREAAHPKGAEGGGGRRIPAQSRTQVRTGLPQTRTQVRTQAWTCLCWLREAVQVKQAFPHPGYGS